MLDTLALESAIFHHLAVALTHCLWEGTVIALVAVVAARGLQSAKRRYSVYLTAFVLMAVCLPITFGIVSCAESRSIAIGEEISPQPGSAHDGRLTPGNLPHSEQGVAATPALPAASDTETASSRAPASATALVTTQSKLGTGRLDVSRGVIAVYALGVVAMFLRLAVSVGGGVRLRRDSVLADGELAAAVRRAAKRIRLLRVPSIAFCEHVSGPVVVGIVRPMILLPITFTTGLTPEQIDAIFTHELAHVRRYDHLVLMGQRIVEALLFFHPAV